MVLRFDGTFNLILLSKLYPKQLLLLKLFYTPRKKLISRLFHRTDDNAVSEFIL